MKNISTIQKFAKFGKVIATIEFVVYVLVAVVCAFGLVFASFASSDVLPVIQQAISEYYNYTVTRNDYYGALLMIFISLLELLANGFVILSVKNYFKHELKAGTPYTREGVAELKRVGYYKIFIPVAASLIATILGVILGFSTVDGTTSVNFVLQISEPVFIGMLFVVLSLVCENTVDLLEMDNKVQQPQESEQN